jgi:adenosine 3'-phospho 5'-phosphosulfate transporter B3
MMSTEAYQARSEKEAIHLKTFSDAEVDLLRIKQNAIFAFLASRHVPPEVLCYMLIFFAFMTFMKLSLEAATKEFSDLDSLASAVTLFQFGFCLLSPLIVSRGEGLKRFPRTIGGFAPYIRLSIVIFGATGVATQSVKYVSYPTRAVFKSAKLITTMMVATVLQRKIYGKLECAAAVMLCAGAAGYACGSGSGDGMQSNSWHGIVLLTTSIFCDAIAPNLQNVLMLPFEAPHSKSKAAGLSAT